MHEVLDNGRETDAVLTDLSKVFDFINHNLLITKCNAYGVEKSSFHFIYSDLAKRIQRTKIESSFSPSETFLRSVPQASILGSLLFNICICDMFFEVPSNIAFAENDDDHTPYTYFSKMYTVLNSLH